MIQVTLVQRPLPAQHVAQALEFESVERVIRPRHLDQQYRRGEMQAGFGKLDMAVPVGGNYIYESYRAEDGAVVVLGLASPAAIVRERMPPLAYSVRIGPDGHAEDGEWQR